MKRVLIVNWRWYNTGGDWTYLLTLINFYQRNDYEVFGLSTYSEKNEVLEGVELFAVKGLLSSDNKGKYLVNYPYRLWRQNEIDGVLLSRLKALDVSLVHVNSIHNSVGTRFLLSLPIYIPILYTLHDYHLSCPVTRHIDIKENICMDCMSKGAFKVVNKQCRDNSIFKSVASYYSFLRSSSFDIFNRVDKYICPSIFISDVHKSLGIPESKIVVVNNPVIEVVERFRMVNDRKHLIYVGRYEKIKGIRTLLEAVNGIKEASLSLYGKGPMEDEINEFISENSLEERVRNFGFLGRNEISGKIANAGAVIIPSEWLENYPYSVSEALALGIPVIGSDLGGIPEMIHSGMNGYIFSHGDIDDLKKVIRKFFDSGVQWSRSQIINQSNDIRSISLWTTRMNEILEEVINVKRTEDHF